jgi:arylsulfatase A-like enzyme
MHHSNRLPNRLRQHTAAGPRAAAFVLAMAVMVAGGLFVPGTAAAESGEQPASRPNFVFIFTDDQAPDTIAALGHPHLHTPNMDRLVERGVTFTYAYNPGSWSPAVCLPSRAMINSGRSLWRSNDARTLDAFDRGYRYWSHLLSDAGYETYMTGKWHIPAPVRRAFDHVGTVRAGMPAVFPRGKPEAYDRPIEGEPDEWDPADPSRGGFWAGGQHWSEALADEAEAFIEQAARSDKPFFMYLAFNAPHDPRQAPAEYFDLYPVDEVPLPENFMPEYPYAEQIGAPHRLRDEFLAPMPRTEYAIRTHRREYYAIVSHMDTQIGRVLDKLDTLGLTDNTYIIFTSDHGLAVGRHGLVGKQNMYEHSVRVPLMIVGPGLEPGKRVDQRVYLQDVMPTTLELAGVETPDFVEFRSLVPLARGDADHHYDAIYGAYLERQRMVIVGDWKLMVYPTVPKLRLFDLANDPLEINDLADDPTQASRVRELFHTLLRLQKQFDDPLDLSERVAKLVD